MPWLDRFPAKLCCCHYCRTLCSRTMPFCGTIPNGFGLIGIGARLFLHSNSFSGSTPSELGLLTNMMGLDLDANALSGTIPKEIKEMTGLLYFDLSDLPLLDGTIPFGFGSRSQNGYFNVSSSGLSGTMPLEVCNLINSRSCADTTMGQWEINCTLEFDGSPQLCGCDCPCSS